MVMQMQMLFKKITLLFVKKLFEMNPTKMYCIIYALTRLIHAQWNIGFRFDPMIWSFLTEGIGMQLMDVATEEKKRRDIRYY